MKNPKFIRVHGTLYRRRSAEVPTVIRVGGYFYKLSQHSEERAKALDMIEDFQQALQTAVESVPEGDQQADKVRELFKKINVSMGNVAARVANHDDEQAKEFWRRTGNVLLQAMPLMKRTFTDVAARWFGNLAIRLDETLEELFQAVESAELAKEEDAEPEPKKQMHANFERPKQRKHPPFIQVSGNLYRLKAE